MKLALIFPHFSKGGVERAAAGIGNAFAARDWDVTLITNPKMHEVGEAYKLCASVRRVVLQARHGSAWKFLPRSRIVEALRSALALRAALRKGNVEIVLSFMPAANAWLALASVGAGWVAIGSERSYHARETWLERMARRLFYRHLDAVTAQTTEVARWLFSNTKARTIPVIPNAVTWPIPSAEPFLLPDAILPSDRLVLLAVGRMDDGQKGFDLLIDAFATLAEQHKEWDLVILGEGSLRTAFEGQIDAHGLAGRIHMPGAAGNIGDWYGRGSLFVLSSRWEGMPNVLLEAMAYGVASVSFDCKTGPGDIIRHEMDGLLVPPENVAELARALSELMGNDEKRTLLAARAMEVRERFAPERIMAQWETLFTDLHRAKRST